MSNLPPFAPPPPPVKPDVRVHADPEALRRAAAQEVLRIAQETLTKRKVVTLALSGGKTPRGLYSLLGGEGDVTYRSKMPWPAVHLFWGDERPVPADHPDSNYGMVRAALLEKVTLTRKQVHRVKTEGYKPAQAAHEYERELKEFFGQQLMLRYDVPRFDLAILGLGADGHVAGLFPGNISVREKRLLVTAPKIDDPAKQRITMTMPVFNMAQNVMFLVTGADKAEAVKASLQGAPEPDRWPAQGVKPSDGKVLWMLDREAASLLAK
jgi:6-phosphogluconolactonase